MHYFKMLLHWFYSPYLCFILQMFKSSHSWKTLPNKARPDLNALISQLVKSKASSTSARYQKEIEKFSTWCKSFGMNPVPPLCVPTVLAYLAKVYKESNSYSTLVLVHAALKWFHSFVPDLCSNPLDSPVCRNLLESAKRSKPAVNKKKPLTVSMIKEIVDKYAGPSANLKDLRLACICSLGFAGFFRYDEISNICPVHIEFSSNYIKIFVPKAKNDVYREGNSVYISRLNNAYCPVALLDRYMQEAGISPTSSEALFQNIRFYKASNSYRLCSTKLSYSRCLESFKECLSKLGYDAKLYGLHSLRSGGASSAVKNNKGITDRLLKLHGRWKTDTAKDMYILEETDNRLSVSSNLGL